MGATRRRRRLRSEFFGPSRPLPTPPLPTPPLHPPVRAVTITALTSRFSRPAATADRGEVARGPDAVVCPLSRDVYIGTL